MFKLIFFTKLSLNYFSFFQKLSLSQIPTHKTAKKITQKTNFLSKIPTHKTVKIYCEVKKCSCLGSPVELQKRISCLSNSVYGISSV